MSCKLKRIKNMESYITKFYFLKCKTGEGHNLFVEGKNQGRDFSREDKKRGGKERERSCEGVK